MRTVVHVIMVMLKLSRLIYGVASVIWYITCIWFTSPLYYTQRIVSVKYIIRETETKYYSNVFPTEYLIDAISILWITLKKLQKKNSYMYNTLPRFLQIFHIKSPEIATMINDSVEKQFTSF